MNSKNIFNDHSNLKGQHAIFSPSQSAWLRYDEEKIFDKLKSQYRAPLGTEIHEYAAYQIELRHKVSNVRNLIKEIENHIYAKYTYSNNRSSLSNYGLTLLEEVRNLPTEVFETLKFYINDGIGFRMEVEQPLVYSEEIYGTADTISFKNNLLRIHDLKTGNLPAHMEQLEIYAALFCLEYNHKPADIDIELRIYQLNNVLVHQPTVEDILPIMDKIVTIDRMARKITSI